MKKLAHKINAKFYYGWIIVFISAYALMFSAPGQTYSISIFINVYETEFGYSQTALSQGYSIATILSGSLLIFIGKLTDRFGQRFMLALVGTLLALTTIYNSYVANIWMIYVGFFLLRYFGQGSLTLIPSSLVPQWFEKKRAFSLSIAGYGNLIATMFVPVFNVFLIDRYTWQLAWRIWGGGLLILFVPLVLLFVINRPEDVGIKMENNGMDDDETEKALILLEASSWTLKEAVKTKAFWMIGLMSLIVPMFTTGITFHWISMMRLRGIERTEAAIVIGLVALPAILMPVISRIFIDKIQPKFVFLTTLIIVLIGMIWLGYFVNHIASAILFMLFYGFGAGMQGIALNTIYPNYYGRKYLGSIRGAATVFMVIGSALGPLPFGYMYDKTGEYLFVIQGMILMTLVAIVLSLAINKPIRKTS